MPARLAVLKTPPKSSVSSLLPLYKNSAFLTRPESTLLQVLIPLHHFNSPTINTYKKPGGGSPPLTRKVLQLVTSGSQPNLLPTLAPKQSTPRLFSPACSEVSMDPTRNPRKTKPLQIPQCRMLTPRQT